MSSDVIVDSAVGSRGGLPAGGGLRPGAGCRPGAASSAVIGMPPAALHGGR